MCSAPHGGRPPPAACHVSARDPKTLSFDHACRFATKPLFVCTVPNTRVCSLIQVPKDSSTTETTQALRQSDSQAPAMPVLPDRHLGHQLSVISCHTSCLVFTAPFVRASSGKKMKLSEVEAERTEQHFIIIIKLHYAPRYVYLERNR